VKQSICHHKQQKILSAKSISYRVSMSLTGYPHLYLFLTWKRGNCNSKQPTMQYAHFTRRTVHKFLTLLGLHLLKSASSTS